MEFLLLLIINSLFIVGLHHATTYELTRFGDVLKTESRLLWPLRYYAEQYLTTWIYKPLIGCVACMASFWGTIFFVVQYLDVWTWTTWFNWIIYIFALSATNQVINKQIGE